MKNVGLILVAGFLVGATMMSGRVRLATFSIQEEGSDFLISWQSEVEEDVRQFELLRKTPNSNDQFVPIYEIAAHGVGRAYGFRDSQVFKAGSDKLDYQLEVVYMTGVREVIRVQSMNYTSTAIRSTWGSLKAMFQ